MTLIDEIRNIPLDFVCTKKEQDPRFDIMILTTLSTCRVTKIRSPSDHPILTIFIKELADCFRKTSFDAEGVSQIPFFTFLDKVLLEEELDASIMTLKQNHSLEMKVAINLFSKSLYYMSLSGFYTSPRYSLPKLMNLARRFDILSTIVELTVVFLLQRDSLLQIRRGPMIFLLRTLTESVKSVKFKLVVDRYISISAIESNEKLEEIALEMFDFVSQSMDEIYELSFRKSALLLCCHIANHFPESERKTQQLTILKILAGSSFLPRNDFQTPLTPEMYSIFRKIKEMFFNSEPYGNEKEHNVRHLRFLQYLERFALLNAITFDTTSNKYIIKGVFLGSTPFRSHYTCGLFDIKILLS